MNAIVWVKKNPFKVQKRPMDFTVQKVYGCDFHITVTFEKLSLIEFCMIPKKNIQSSEDDYNTTTFPVLYVRLDFL